MKPLIIIWIIAFVWQCNAKSQCQDKNLFPRTDFHFEQLIGKWYGNEIIAHEGDVDLKLPENKCLILHFDDISQDEVRRLGWPQSYQFLRMTWDEAVTEAEYALLSNVSKPGHFLLSEPRESEEEIDFNSFVGNIQVLVHVEDYILLSICEVTPVSRSFSVILTREPIRLTPEAEVSAEKLLKQRGLPIQSVRKVCTNSEQYSNYQRDDGDGKFNEDSGSGNTLLTSFSKTTFLTGIIAALSLFWKYI